MKSIGEGSVWIVLVGKHWEWTSFLERRSSIVARIPFLPSKVSRGGCDFVGSNLICTHCLYLIFAFTVWHICSLGVRILEVTLIFLAWTVLAGSASVECSPFQKFGTASLPNFVCLLASRKWFKGVVRYHADHDLFVDVLAPEGETRTIHLFSFLAG